MKKISLIIPAILGCTCLTSCNKGLNRIVYTEKDFSQALAAYKKIKNAQTKDGVTTLFDHGKIAYTYSLIAKGTLRYDDLSFRNIDIDLSTNYTISWSLKDKYLKIVGDKETIQYVYDDSDKTYKDKYYWKLEDYKRGDKTIYERTNLIESGQLGADESFSNFVLDKINYYTTISIPTIMNISFGLDGSMYDVGYIFTTDVDYCTDYFFNEEVYKNMEKIKEAYKKAGEGYNLNYKYGVKDDTATCISLNGKVNVKDFHENECDQGYLNIDAFSSFKDNFISQMEVKANGRIINDRKINIDSSIDLYVSEQVSQDECKVDSHTLSKYDDITNE